MSAILTADHTQAFDEAFALSGATIDIDGNSVSAILPRELSQTQLFDADGINQFEGASEVIVKTAQLPTITLDSVVTISGVEFRINATREIGSIATQITIERP